MKTTCLLQLGCGRAGRDMVVRERIGYSQRHRGEGDTIQEGL